MDLWKVEFNDDPGDFDLVAVIARHPGRPGPAHISFESTQRTGLTPMVECEVLATTINHGVTIGKKFFSNLVFDKLAKPLAEDDDLVAFIGAEHKSVLYEKIIKGETAR